MFFPITSQSLSPRCLTRSHLRRSTDHLRNRHTALSKHQDCKNSAKSSTKQLSIFKRERNSSSFSKTNIRISPYRAEVLQKLIQTEIRNFNSSISIQKDVYLVDNPGSLSKALSHLTAQFHTTIPRSQIPAIKPISWHASSPATSRLIP